MWSFMQHSSLLQESDQRRHLGVGISCMVYWTSTTAQHNHYNRPRKRADRGHGDERERDTKSRASWMCGTSLGGISVGTITISGTAQPHLLISLLGNIQHAIEHKIWNTMPPCIGSQKEPRSLTSSMPSVHQWVSRSVVPHNRIHSFLFLETCNTRSNTKSEIQCRRA